jgi:hypothetical protein
MVDDARWLFRKHRWTGQWSRLLSQVYRVPPSRYVVGRDPNEASHLSSRDNGSTCGRGATVMLILVACWVR